ncbi:mRNA splicing protein prp18 [Puccinia graminis f. sp. tritici]|uniref:Pre-mRNA-splicing factor 18 n=2 Tax=Puccinia graminis f. sp. tritici TaxID=56615 RepID=E3JZI5_PUCGT|nr:uncharacterized protein PGTG_03416 [Puccinia graminis f. sp. tritici CRL 75-36-700-3]EFP77460.1 hypothetical protein PGTG_03416 [Puccinia graminis f. sp. tritici CRL 75-36-700-3]KAA1110513.1 mRNA splicing protein prp18 [Puccinia graminis f. sp. tritici]
MDTLKAEIELKRKSSNNPENTEGQQPTKKKYMRKGDLAKLEAERQLEEKKKKLEAEKLASDELKQKKMTDSLKKDSLNSKQANSGSATPNPQTEAENENQPELFNISNEEAVRRLRNKGQPIRLFGESDKERRLRLRALQLIEERTEGGRNELMQALEGVEGKMDLEVLPKHTKDSSKTNHSKSAGLGGAGGDLEGSGNDSDGDLAATQDGEVTVDLNLIKTEPRKIYPQIYFALKRVLKEWEQSMAERPDHIRRSAQGKLVAATQKQSAEYLKPLFKSLRKRELAPDVLQAVAEIVHHMQTREYIRANDAYLRLSIGNAPWPIGVTMVGIHERSGREKIFSNNVAHVLNDEVSRKYIQSLKRILTFAQTKRPPDDLARKMG